ncbi:tetraacyldisaccharide 4'-kinase [Geotalea uraniireducens]|uniref:Tetraacyldisaccharide 4'-kinase n=1 Tax=Geotalea uraniireducens TaxID=351604 RepID=A0ABM8EJD7_9BACT|nr:tetraacyldisaccharide 4'-kinase [Geotalea uraniireducens]BDV42544.1 tetraacyldisaccharide 4'-kinase [Geotalea uraniireducens]
MKGEAYFRRLVAGERRSVLERLLMALLGLLAVPYALVLRLRALAYATGLVRTRRLARPVISVGNLTVGGTGKTPTTALVARLLMARGKRVAVLSRGYGGSLEGEARLVADGRTVFHSAAEAGDEPVLLADMVPGLMVVIGRDRYAAGLLAQERLDPDVFILDDGYQHLRLHRDLNILLLDCRQPLGNGRTLPAGLLREPPSALGRADLLIYTRCPDASPPLLPGAVPACRARHRLLGLEPAVGGPLLGFSALHGRRGVAFAGIADPEAFFTALRQAGLDLAATVRFPDHAGYGDAERDRLLAARDASGADYLVTTGKDAVKLAAQLPRLGAVYVAALELQLDDPAPLQTALDKVLQRS